MKQIQAKIAVVMVTYNKYTYIRELLKSFANLNYDRSLLDVTVVDNASADGTEEKLRKEFGEQINIIQTGANLGGAGGFNTGMRHALANTDAKYIWLLDNDVEVEPDALNHLLAAIETDPKIAAVGSMVLQLDARDTVSEIGAQMNWLQARVEMLDANRKVSELKDLSLREVDYCAACSILKKRSALEEIGLWEDLFIHFDDVDWCLRAKAKGYKIYCEPKSIVFHESMKHKQATWIRYYNIRNLLYLYAHHKKLLLPLVFGKFLIWSLMMQIHGLSQNASLGFSALWHFLTNKKASQKFALENYKNLKELDWKSIIEKEHKMIFYNTENFHLFSSDHKLNKNSRISFYKLSQEERKRIQKQHPELKIEKLSLLDSFSKTLIILDGALESHFMLPCFSKKVIVYPLYGTYLDKRGNCN